MGKEAAILAVLVSLALAPGASAVTIQGPASDSLLPRLRNWAAHSAVPTANATITVVPTSCPEGEVEACSTTTGPFQLYMPDGGAQEEATHLNFLHELGHVFDFSARTHRYRARFLSIMHFGGTAWMDSEVQPDELFAMAYSYCAAGLDFPRMKYALRHIYWGYGYSPTARQYRQTCALLRQAYAER
jgi:hypothetical protein